MAQLLVAGRYAFPGPLGAYLREALPDSFSVVIDPIVQRYPLDAVVVGPGGLVVVQAMNGSASPQGAAGAAPAPRGQKSPADPGTDSEHATKALEAFLRDEFPALHPAIHYLSAAAPEDETHTWTVVEPVSMKDQNLAESAIALQSQADPTLADEDVRESLALALRDRQITANQRTSHPFVFRSGGPLGNAAKAWTIRDAVRHMDRHPEDGIYHLRNGTLAQWLADEGAEHLAELARAVVRQSRTDPRVSLETFLLGTGLVERPRLKARPPRVDLGYILAGEAASGSVRLEKGRGRGYLFGSLTPGEPWLDAEPRTFTGGPADVVVRADTGSLRISSTSYQADLYVDSSASEKPAAVPVRFRVMAMPSAANRYVLRPLAGAMLAAILGAVAGLELDLYGSVPLGTGFIPSGVAPWAWTLLVGLLWAILGAIRGLRQPLAWPIGYAALRWLGWLAGWGALLVAVAFGVGFAWIWAGVGGEAGLSPTLPLTAALFGLAVAALPATLAELAASRPSTEGSGTPTVRPGIRMAVAPALGVLLIAALLAGAPMLRPAWQSDQAQRTAVDARAVALSGWSRLNDAADALLDRLYLRYYDRRAPEQPAATPAPPGQTPGAPPATP